MPRSGWPCLSTVHWRGIASCDSSKVGDLNFSLELLDSAERTSKPVKKTPGPAARRQRRVSYGGDGGWGRAEPNGNLLCTIYRSGNWCGRSAQAACRPRPRRRLRRRRGDGAGCAVGVIEAREVLGRRQSSRLPRHDVELMTPREAAARRHGRRPPSEAGGPGEGMAGAGPRTPREGSPGTPVGRRRRASRDILPGPQRGADSKRLTPRSRPRHMLRPRRGGARDSASGDQSETAPPGAASAPTPGTTSTSTARAQRSRRPTTARRASRR